MKTKVILLAISTLISLLFAEIALRFIVPPPMINSEYLTSENGLKYGWAPSPRGYEKMTDYENGGYFSFRTNSRGWKDVEHTLEKPQGVIRILFIGDSFTYGLTPIESGYPRQLDTLIKQHGIKNVEVISIGVAGWGTDQELEALSEEGLKYHPDLVVYQFCANDVTDNLKPLESTRPDELYGFKPFRYYIENDTLKKHIYPPRKDWKTQVKAVVKRSALLYYLNKSMNAVKVYFHKESVKKTAVTKKNTLGTAVSFKDNLGFQAYYSIKDSQTSRNAWKLMEALILKMNQICRDQGVRFAAFSKSEAEERRFFIRWSMLQNDGQTDYFLIDGQKQPIDFFLSQKKLAEICRIHQIPFMIPQRSYDRLPIDNHLNVMGNHNLALDLMDFILKEKLLGDTLHIQNSE